MVTVLPATVALASPRSAPWARTGMAMAESAARMAYRFFIEILRVNGELRTGPAVSATARGLAPGPRPIPGAALPPAPCAAPLPVDRAAAAPAATIRRRASAPA